MARRDAFAVHDHVTSVLIHKLASRSGLDFTLSFPSTTISLLNQFTHSNILDPSLSFLPSTNGSSKGQSQLLWSYRNGTLTCMHLEWNVWVARVHRQQGPSLDRSLQSTQSRRRFQGRKENCPCPRGRREEEAQESPQGDVQLLHLQGCVCVRSPFLLVPSSDNGNVSLNTSFLLSFFSLDGQSPQAGPP